MAERPKTLEPGSPEDAKVLLELLTTIESQLRILVFERPNVFRQEFQNLLPGPWEEVSRRFELARRQITENNLDWHYVEGVGLTSDHARWKQNLLNRAIKTGVWARILKLCNAILGSLSGALPVVEFIKEYKDCVEACLRIIRVPVDDSNGE